MSASIRLTCSGGLYSERLKRPQHLPHLRHLFGIVLVLVSPRCSVSGSKKSKLWDPASCYLQLAYPQTSGSAARCGLSGFSTPGRPCSKHDVPE